MEVVLPASEVSLLHPPPLVDSAQPQVLRLFFDPSLPRPSLPQAEGRGLK
jgi:hypothetical protein